MKSLFPVAALLLLAAACTASSIPGEDDVGTGPADNNATADKSPDAGLRCTGTKTKCGGECVELKTSVDHCGACGSSCASGTTCANGFCSSEGSCAANRLSCGTKCIDPQTDNDHCGACGHSCGDAGACSKGGCPGELRVRALIDGSSQLVFSGAKVKWHVVSAAAPGRWAGHDDATTLSGTPWVPVWPSSGENRDCKCDSQPSPDVPAPLKAVEQTVTLTKVEGRNSATIAEQPSAANGYTLKVGFSDPSDGAGWYEIVLKYTSN